MKLKELKEKFQHKFLMRMTAGILCVAVAAGGFGISGMHTGEVSAVEAAIARARESVARSGMYLDSTVIAHPDPQICKSIL